MIDRRIAALCCSVFLAGCGGGASSAPAEAGVAAAARTEAEAPASAAHANASAETSPATPFAALVDRLSEPDGEFFSDNVISNETSYLQVAGALDKTRLGAAYVGVGPEQNFSYIAITKPKIAFIVDIRRQNLVLQLLYKATFEEATSRAHFVAMLLGRAFDASTDPGAAADIDAVLASATKIAPSEASFAATHARLVERIARDVSLDARDLRSLELSHRAFFKGQLDTRFSLKEANGRVYPTLKELVRQEDPGGHRRGFLASEVAFRTVQTMENEGRIVPVVGDFAGDRAMPGIAAYLRERGLTVGAFYVSNVEQYLFEPKVWSKWTRNVGALPIDESSVFIRAYLDQGKRHPLQLSGHRSATVLQRMADFDEHESKRRYASFWDVATAPFSGG